MPTKYRGPGPQRQQRGFLTLERLRVEAAEDKIDTVVLGFAGIYWLASARNWFTGPKVQGTPEELAAIERDLSA